VHVCILRCKAPNSGPIRPIRGPNGLGWTATFVHVTATYGGAAPHLRGWIAMPSNNQLSITEHLPEGSGADGPMVVLVHGSLDSSRSFGRVLRRLSDVHTVAYDRRGYQRSRQALPFGSTFDGHIDDLLSVIGGRPAVVVGHSYGGSIALGAALRPGPFLIRAVVAYEPPMPWLEHAMGIPGRTATSPAWTEVDPHDPEKAGAEAERFFRRMVGDAAWERLPDGAKDDRRADGPALAAELNAIRVTEAPFDVATMRVPVIYGIGGDAITRRRDAVRWLVEHTPESEEAIIPGADHGAHLTHPDAFAALARSALARSATVRPGVSTGTGTR
jgi:pimeloyl-ACP methyl ester carboxylesterase